MNTARKTLCSHIPPIFRGVLVHHSSAVAWQHWYQQEHLWLGAHSPYPPRERKRTGLLSFLFLLSILFIIPCDKACRTFLLRCSLPAYFSAQPVSMQRSYCIVRWFEGAVYSLSCKWFWFGGKKTVVGSHHKYQKKEILLPPFSHPLLSSRCRAPIFSPCKGFHTLTLRRQSL